MTTDPRITNVRTYVCDTAQKRNFLFVLVETDTALVGVGEGSQSDQDDAVVANIRQLERFYVGRTIFELVERRGRLLRSRRTGRAMFIATSALEQALWDLMGKALGAPVYRLLGGACHDRIRCYATIAPYADIYDSVETLADEAGRCVTEGFTAIKIVPFRGLRWDHVDSSEGRRAFREGLERIEAVRARVGDDVDVLIECSFAFDRTTAVRIARSLEPYNCYWIEAPLQWDDAADLAVVRAAIPQRLASGETLHGRRAFRELLEQRAIDVVQPDVKWTGGIFEAKKIAAWAETYQIALAPHNNSGPVATAASAHVAMTCPNTLLLEVPSRRPAWEDALIEGHPLVNDGHVSRERLAEKPGLGIAFDEDVARAASAH